MTSWSKKVTWPIPRLQLRPMTPCWLAPALLRPLPISLLRARTVHTIPTMDLTLPSTVPAQTHILTTAHKLEILDHQQYNAPSHLTPDTVLPSPLDQFRAWFAEIQPYVREPEAMSLSTATARGVPSARVLLLKQVDDRGFVFFTNYGSRKSREMDETGWAAMAWYWREVSRQVRVVGKVEKVGTEESEAYFRSRPLGSRIGAWASKQSTVVAEGEVAKRVEEAKAKFGVQGEDETAEVPLPEFWGGWRVVPHEVEFWLGKPSRLHDRVRYLRKEGSPDDSPEWTIEMLSP
ncbi:pyridoxamine 5'-phosphate oxidase [Amylostereum chailletii]|nr:pyridoxamine 5'-phosphate oxidase [Amylostereum chailletii]